ncbi:MAG TPA: IS110 family transposase [Albitalea sp.]|uniref:IS110 family transposase n=1 Tax=Piscinibacter sp. TaxID=1903157 RepID=UPI002ED0632B
MDRTTYAVDIAKHVMQAHWVDAQTGEIGRRKLTRAKFLEFFAKVPAARVVMEACGGAHHWARCLRGLGHEAQLLPARQVRAFVRGNKDDSADARGLWLASQHDDIRRVPVKSCEQQAILSLHRMREHWKSVRNQTINALRGLLYEFGVVLPKGRTSGLRALAQQRADIDARLAAPIARMVDAELIMLGELDKRLQQLEAEINATSTPTATKLRKVCGIGPLSASALAATLGDGTGWRSAREFSASLGLVPAHNGTGGKIRMGHLTKRGDTYLRTLLMHGARAVVAQAKNKPQWLQKLLLRRPVNVAVAALANKMARVAWALVAHQRTYDPNWLSIKPQ